MWRGAALVRGDERGGVVHELCEEVLHFLGIFAVDLFLDQLHDLLNPCVLLGEGALQLAVDPLSYSLYFLPPLRTDLHKLILHRGLGLLDPVEVLLE